MIEYRSDRRPALHQARELYEASTLGARRPLDDAARFAAMLANANLLVTAWEDALLVGIARCQSDFVWTTYLADLAVRASHQRRGIGKELIRQCRRAAPQATIVLLAAPAATAYYPHIGFEHASQAWLLRAGQDLT